MDSCELEASLLYRVNSRISRADCYTEKPSLKNPTPLTPPKKRKEKRKKCVTSRSIRIKCSVSYKVALHSRAVT